MKSNIDLTVNRDFQRKREFNFRGIASDRMGNISLIRNEPNNSINDSEINTNFLVGSINNIKDRFYRLELIRSSSNIESGCDCCGGYLYIKTNTLCDRCNKEMDDEFKDKEILGLLMR